MTGRKADQKLYRHHSGFPGGLKEIPFKVLLEQKPEEVRSPLRRLDRSLRDGVTDHSTSRFGDVAQEPTEGQANGATLHLS